MGHVKRPHRHGRWKYHEPQWVQRKRWLREYWTRRWKAEVRNTAQMALWWKFRVNATESYDREQYENYLRQREERRLKEQLRDEKYTAWTLSQCIEDTDYISYNKTLTETEHLNSMKPESFLANLKHSFLEKQRLRTSGYALWKDNPDLEVIGRSDVKAMENTQAMRSEGVGDVKGFDWITASKHLQRGAMEHDADFLQKSELIRQHN